MTNKKARTILSAIIIMCLLWPIEGSRVPLVIGILLAGIPHSFMLFMGITQLPYEFGSSAPYLVGMGAMLEAVWEIAVEASNFGAAILWYQALPILVCWNLFLNGSRSMIFQVTYDVWLLITLISVICVRVNDEFGLDSLVFYHRVTRLAFIFLVFAILIEIWLWIGKHNTKNQYYR